MFDLRHHIRMTNMYTVLCLFVDMHVHVTCVLKVGRGWISVTFTLDLCFCLERMLNASFVHYNLHARYLLLTMYNNNNNVLPFSMANLVL